MPIVLFSPKNTVNGSICRVIPNFYGEVIDYLETVRKNDENSTMKSEVRKN